MKTTRKLGSDVRIRTPVLLPCSCPFVMMVVTVGVQDIQQDLVQVLYRAALPAVLSVPEVRESSVFTFSLILSIFQTVIFYHPFSSQCYTLYNFVNFAAILRSRPKSLHIFRINCSLQMKDNFGPKKCSCFKTKWVLYDFHRR